MEVVRPAAVMRLHEGHPNALVDPAVDRAVDQHRVDRPADIVRRYGPANDWREGSSL